MDTVQAQTFETSPPPLRHVEQDTAQLLVHLAKHGHLCAEDRCDLVAEALAGLPPAQQDTLAEGLVRLGDRWQAAWDAAYEAHVDTVAATASIKRELQAMAREAAKLHLAAVAAAVSTAETEAAADIESGRSE